MNFEKKRGLEFALFSFLLMAGCTSIAIPVQENISTIQTMVPEASQTSIDIQELTPSASPILPDYLSIAREASARGDFQEALDAAQSEIENNPENDHAYLLRGNIYFKLGDANSALDDFARVIELNPSNMQAYYSRALVLSSLRDFEGALIDFSTAIDFSPNFALAYRNRASAQTNLGHFEAAVLDLQIYLNLVPVALDRAMIEAKILEMQGEQQVDGQLDGNENGLLFFDDFSNADSGWYANGDPALLAYYDQDGYRIIHPQANAAGWALPGRLFSNISIDVLTEKQGGVDDNFFGLMCRVQGTTGSASFYIFMISSDGYYGIGKRVEGGELVLIGQQKLQASSAIKKGGAINQIHVECDEDRLALTVNGTLIAEEYDSDLTTGQIGLVVGTFSEGGTNILFNNLSVFNLD